MRATQMQTAAPSAEQRELAALEVIFEECQTAWQKASEALAAIKAKKLYKTAGFKSWDEYCRKRWKFGADAADRKIRLGKIVHELTPSALGISELAERHAAALAGFPPDMRQEIFEEAEKSAPGGKLTEAWLEQTGRRLMDARIAELNEATEDEAEAEEDGEDDEDASEDDSEEAAPRPKKGASADDQAVHDAAGHTITRKEELDKADGQGKRWATRGQREAHAKIEIVISLDQLEAIAGLLAEDKAAVSPIQAWQKSMERWARKGDRLGLTLNCTPQDLLEKYGS